MTTFIAMLFLAVFVAAILCLAAMHVVIQREREIMREELSDEEYGLWEESTDDR